MIKLLKRTNFGMRNPKAYCKENDVGALPMRSSPQVLT